MSLPLSLIDTIIGTMLGGVIAGLIGFFVARYESGQIRRERHLHEHQANFRKIQKALVEVKTKTWIPSATGAQGFRLPKWDKDPSEALREYNILGYTYLEEVKKEMEFQEIDEILYSDIPKHFPDVWVSLTEVQNLVRTDGVKINQILYKLSEFIYDKISRSNLEVLKSDWSTKCKLCELDKPSDGQQNYASWVFLLMIDENGKNWPGEYYNLVRYNILEGLKEFAEELETEFGPEKDQMLMLVNNVFRKIEDCDKIQEVWLHKMKLKGNCGLL
jgi:hypothetical protein